ncbi:MAG TPA: xanthine dehydrogenase family protein molybdopterin-binding subunit [Blastococcus sp.]|nr:xanthine dehydrogenase family protein molybdopterin-binding subunit [Blastococcus sp.]
MTASQIGVSARRVGGADRVTGSQRFVGDVRLDNMLHVKLVTLDCARARILAVDTSAAERVDGVRAVLTAADLPDPMPRFGPVHQDRPVLAVGETKFHGEPVAAVAAETEEAADEAAALVRVTFEELPAVLTVDAALDPGAPLVQDPCLRTGPHAATNTLRGWDFGWGDVDAATAECVVEQTYTFPMVTHFAIEPHVFLAAAERDGVTVWSAIQHPYLLQSGIAKLLDLPIAKVRVIAPDPGGAFGGKQHAKFEPLVAFLALRTGRPVRLALTLAQTFQAVRRTAYQVHMRTGFAADGTIAFQDVECNGLLGAYADIGVRVVSKSTYLMCGPYRVPDARVHVRALLSHTPPATAFRGFGTPQVAWAVESQMDEAARRLGIDRLELRLRNLARRGEEIVAGDKPADGDWPESVRKAAEAIGWGTPLAPNRGRGIGVAVKSSATTGASYAIVRLHMDGSATVLAGTSDMGQGARTVLAQIAAEELGLTPDAVQVVMGDTGMAPFDLQTSASRSTVFMGTAVLEACRDVQRQVAELAANAFEVGADDIELDRGTLRVGERSFSFAELLVEAFAGVRGEVIGVGSRRGETVLTHALGGSPSFYEFNCTAVEVEVDRETGELLIVKHVSVADVGRALNPAHVEAQDEGAAIMGLGHTLMEHLIFDEHGRIVNLGALDYRIPTTKDVPLELHSLLVENGDGPGPYGAKGAGEGGLFAVSPAVASALTEATGAVIRELPLTAERVWRALDQQS